MWEKKRTRKGGDRERAEEEGNTREQKTERQEQKVTKNKVTKNISMGEEGNDRKSFTVGGVGAGADGPAADGAGRVAEF